MLGAFLVEESESESESVVAGDQEGDDVEEDASDAVVDGDGESGEADNLDFFCVNIDFGFYLSVSVLTIALLLEF